MQCGAIVRWAIDTDQRRAAALPGLHEDRRTATDYHMALDDPAVDAVTICLPHNLHAPVAVEAARAGKHVLCEKPLADSLDAADRMIAAAEQADVALMVAENERFNPLVHKMRELLDEGVIGQIALIQMTREVYTTQASRQERPWYNQAQAAAGGRREATGVMLPRVPGWQVAAWRDEAYTPAQKGCAGNVCPGKKGCAATCAPGKEIRRVYLPTYRGHRVAGVRRHCSFPVDGAQASAPIRLGHRAAHGRGSILRFRRLPGRRQ
jgi:hypothetical protein